MVLFTFLTLFLADSAIGVTFALITAIKLCTRVIKRAARASHFLISVYLSCVHHRVERSSAAVQANSASPSRRHLAITRRRVASLLRLSLSLLVVDCLQRSGRVGRIISSHLFSISQLYVVLIMATFYLFIYLLLLLFNMKYVQRVHVI